MNKCTVCGGRTLKTERGSRCMNATCEGANETQIEGVVCECGAEMAYTHSSPYGDRNYACTACTATKTY